MTGFVAYQGPSRLDGAPIVLAVTLVSHNAKTGDMPQAWVLRSDLAPTNAIAAGLDRSICGDCTHRSGRAAGRSCYVIPWLGPLRVFRAFAAGAYPALVPDEGARVLAGRPVRVAAYGDPAAVPFDIWRRLLLHAAPSPSYTHQWRVCDPRFRSFCMASVESAGEADQAHALGWRTFRTRLATEPLRADEIVCPASDEAGHRVTCRACGLCVGRGRPTARSIAIVAHGLRTAFLVEKKTAAALPEVFA